MGPAARVQAAPWPGGGFSSREHVESYRALPKQVPAGFTASWLPSPPGTMQPATAGPASWLGIIQMGSSSGAGNVDPPGQVVHRVAADGEEQGKKKKKGLVNKTIRREELYMYGGGASSSGGHASGSDLKADGDMSDGKGSEGDDREAGGGCQLGPHGFAERALGLPTPEEQFEGELPSIGSAKHAGGACKPCLLFRQEGVGCKWGSECAFCHLEHRRSSQPRQSRSKRDRLRMLLIRAKAAEHEEQQQPLAVGRVFR
uniref:C3H1-type domain-containing protein n=1 Tax=Alexandrium monilatum TaxID=311494 RepID=A0A7S4QMH1_9DINO